MLKKIKIEEAVGMKLAHDVTQIVPGKFKGTAFRRGHVVRKGDLPKLLDLGKKQIYVLNLDPSEGKVDFLAKTFGLLKVNVSALEKINAIESIILSTRHNHSSVRPGEIVAGTRIIPLTIREGKIRKMEEICRKEGPVLKVLPFRSQKVGILVTGSEISEGRIRDRSAVIVKKKVEALGSRVICQAVIPDDASQIAWKIRKMKSVGCRLIIATGGLSVDPDDVTPEGIRRSGAKVFFYGVPVLPGSMSLMARLGKTFILGVPACVVHDPITALDLFLPRILANEPITRKDVIRIGHGGLCLKCGVCRFPICPFGRGK
jgi:molybdenum cofactor synthesis domain-containing protein